MWKVENMFSTATMHDIYVLYALEAEMHPRPLTIICGTPDFGMRKYNKSVYCTCVINSTANLGKAIDDEMHRVLQLGSVV